MRETVVRKVTILAIALAGVVLPAVLVGCGGSGVVEAEEEQFEAVQDLGGTAEINEEGHIIKIDLHGKEVTDQDIERLTELSQLKELILYDTQVTDECLEAVKQFPALEYLDISVTKVTDAGVEQLQQQKPELTVSGPEV